MCARRAPGAWCAGERRLSREHGRVPYPGRAAGARRGARRHHNFPAHARLPWRRNRRGEGVRRRFARGAGKGQHLTWHQR